jgi:glycine hydroxymethyltransferase
MNILQNLKESDPVISNFINSEKNRQETHLELIASENFASIAVMQAQGSVLTNKYAEGLPNKRYYGGCEFVDEIEELAIQRAKKLFNANWANVQPHSGAQANAAVFLSLLKPGDTIMGMDLSHGGHLTHGSPVNMSGKWFNAVHYGVNKKTSELNFNEIREMALENKPKLIICGYSAYSRDLDYERFRKIANINNSYLLCDMAHYSGLVAAKECANPFLYADIVTSTTHKTLAGPRAGMIFYKKCYEEQVNFSTFPAIQGGPHQHQIGALSYQLKFVNTHEFKNYIIQVKKNAKVMAQEFINKGYKLCTNGTDNHLILIDLNPINITGSKIEKICEYVDISINKNSVAGDKSALSPCGIRLGTAALTTRGFKEDDFIKVVEFIDSVIKIALDIQTKSGAKLVDFVKAMESNNELLNIRENINKFANTFEFYN